MLFGHNNTVGVPDRCDTLKPQTTEEPEMESLLQHKLAITCNLYMNSCFSVWPKLEWKTVGSSSSHQQQHDCVARWLHGGRGGDQRRRAGRR